jgi:AcrR family transcriptional regulator
VTKEYPEPLSCVKLSPVTVPGDETRTRILEAAWREITERSSAGVTIGEVATAAGVTRQLVYFHFTNRAGLLTAMARYRDEESGFADQVAASLKMEPVEGLEHLLRAWCAYLPVLLPVAIALEAALVSGDEGGAAWRDRMAELREVLRIAIDRLARRDLLAAGWTVATAADWAWAHIQPTTWRHLVSERGWKPEEYTERTVRSLLDALVRSATPPAPAAARRSHRER